MTQKDYDLIAEVIDSCRYRGGMPHAPDAIAWNNACETMRRMIGTDLAATFEGTGDLRFDRARFEGRANV